MTLCPGPCLATASQCGTTAGTSRQKGETSAAWLCFVKCGHAPTIRASKALQIGPDDVLKHLTSCISHWLSAAWHEQTKLGFIDRFARKGGGSWQPIASPPLPNCDISPRPRRTPPLRLRPRDMNDGAAGRNTFFQLDRPSRAVLRVMSGVIWPLEDTIGDLPSHEVPFCQWRLVTARSPRDPCRPGPQKEG